MNTTTVRPVDFDHHDDSLTWDRVFEIYAELREHQPVAWSEAHGGFWILTRYEDVLNALRDHRTFSSAEGVHLPRPAQQPMIIPIDFDPPEHRWYRRLFEPIVDSRVVDENEAAIETIIRGLVDDLVRRGRGDLVESVAVPLPLQVLSLLLGVSQETASQLRALTAEWWEQAAREDRPSAAVALSDLMMAEVRQRRADPRDDYLTWLDNAQIDGRDITDAELASTLLTLAVAGHETTVNTAGSVMLYLARHPELQDDIREHPERIPGIVEELLRIHSPAHLFARTVTRDTEVGGRTLRTGDKVLLVYAAANLDPSVFAEPTSLDLDREVKRHLAFGWGVHHCVGAHLARRELRILLEVLAESPRFEVDGEVVTTGLIGGHHMGVHKLPVSFDNRIATS